MVSSLTLMSFTTLPSSLYYESFLRAAQQFREKLRLLGGLTLHTRALNLRDGKRLPLGSRTLVMGIVNLTPDSFSDGGRCLTPAAALQRARTLVAEGADLIDLGAESTRPGSTPLSVDEELARLLPALELLLAELPVPVSVDTYKARTALAAARLGVHMLNDVWGLQYGGDAPGAMARVAATFGLPVVAMHNRRPATAGGDLIGEMRGFFARALALADEAGLPRDRLILDPGIGFGKSVAENLLVLRRLAELRSFDGQLFPLLLGTSRKSFIGATLGLPVNERVEATGATCVLGIASGVDLVRVHDVKPIARMCRMADLVLGKTIYADP